MNILQKLIEQEVRKVFKEASYTEADVPKYFWLVTDIDRSFPEKAEQIADGELHGVKGISDTKQILVDWLGIARNTVIIMPAKKFLEVNNVSRVMYDNPHYLVSKTLAATFRLLAKSQDRDYDWQSIIERVMDYITVARKEGHGASDEMQNIEYWIDRGDMSTMWFGRIFRKEKPTINSIKDLAEWVKKASIEVAAERAPSMVEKAKKIEVSEWQSLLTAALKALGRTYQSEGEWLVKDETMTIPKGSTVLVALDTMPKHISDKAKEIAENPDARPKIMMHLLTSEVKQIEFIEWIKSLGLEERYNFSFIPMKKFHAYRKKLYSQND